MSRRNKSKKHVLNLELIAKLQRFLRLVWLVWLGYRSVILPVLLGVFMTTKPNIFSGVAWQVIWLVPALLFTPWMIKGKSPYALLLGSMITLVYLGASGVVVFSRFYDSGISVLWVYVLDTVLLVLINIGLFKLLKALPSMNGNLNKE